MKKGILLIGLSATILASCIEHEVIPAPIPTVELDAHFIGEINNTDVEFTENVLGYSNVTSKSKVILPPPDLSSAVYFSRMASPDVMPSIEIGMGRVFWDASLASDPTVTLFNSFFSSTPNANPGYSDNISTSGFQVIYRDQVGVEWRSSETSVNFQDAEFTGIVQESDSTGDYSKFICNFDCFVYHQDPTDMSWDSIRIQNATYQGWFQR